MIILLFGGFGESSSGAASIADVTIVSAITTGSIQTIPLFLDGLQPVLCLIQAYRTALDIDDAGAPDDHAVMSYGMSDGTSGGEVVVAISSEHNVDPTNTRRWIKTSAMVTILDPATGFVDGEATVSSFGAGQVVLEWTNLPAAAYKLVVWALAGSTHAAEVGTKVLSGAQDATATITHGLGLMTGMVAAGAGSGAILNSFGSQTRARIVVGYGSFDQKTIRQASSGINWPNADASGGLISARRDSQHLIAPSRFSGLPPEPAEPYAEITAVASGSLTITTRNTGVAQTIGYAIITGQRCFAGIWESQTGTGVRAFNMPSGPEPIYPRGVLMNGTRLNFLQINTDSTTRFAGTHAWAALGSIGGGDEACGSVQHQRLTVPTNTQVVVDDSAVHVPAHDGVAKHEGTWEDYLLGGFEMDISDGAGANTKTFPLLLIGITSRDRGTFRGQIRRAAIVLGGVSRAGMQRGRVVHAGAVLGTVSAAVPTRGLIVGAHTALGGAVRAGAQRGRVSRAGVVLGGVAAAREARGGVTRAGVVLGAVVASKAVRGRIARAGVTIGRIASAG